MAHENILLQQSNFCLGPQAGTVCSIDTTNPQTVLRIKNTSGAIIVDLNLSYNMTEDVVGLEYVGPTNLSAIEDDLTFFTFEKVNSSTCLIKRWQTRMSYTELNLKEQVIKMTTGNEYYDALDFAVEYYNRGFSHANEYYNYLEIDSVENIKSGTKLFLGPSTDPDNYGATEEVTVSHLGAYAGGIKVYLTSYIQNQYKIGDNISFYSHVYIYSAIGYAGDTTKGSLFKIDAYNWQTVEIDAKAFYKKVTAARWCPLVEGIASIVDTNMIFVRPYDYYQNWRSFFLNNINAEGTDAFTVYDVIFDNYSIYKLQRKTTLRDDDGERTTYSWDTYNFQQDTLLPYGNSINFWQEQSILTGYNKNVDINIQVRDQYGVGLRDVVVNLYKSGDPGALFDPLNGQVTTDTNGEATVNYRSGSTYMGHTEITGRAVNGSPYNGSAYVWNSNNIISYPETDPVEVLLFQLKEISSSLISPRQINSDFKVWDYNEDEWVKPNVELWFKSYFTTPGGDWGSGGGFILPANWKDWLPDLYYGTGTADGPRNFTGGGFSNWPYIDPIPSPAKPFFIGNQIKLIEDASGETKIISLTNFLLYAEDTDGYVPYIRVFQPNETGSAQFSQLKLGHHTHWVDGVAYDYLWTYTNLNQFVFVEDAIPKFWSEKNPIDTNIWIRLRPFAFSLNISTFKMFVRESSYAGDTNYYEVTSQVQITTFDAGAGILGMEALYNPSQDFHYNATVYVFIEVYDEAPTPNYIYTEYWFKIVPDYKAPYLVNLSPDRDDDNVSVNTQIYFEIKDDGLGVDIDSLEVLLNSRRMHPSNIAIEEISRYHYKVTYTPPSTLYYDKAYRVGVKVNDLSEFNNRLNDAYTFYTAESEGILFTDFDPAFCKRGMHRFNDVKLIALADGNGIDRGSIRMQVFNKDVVPNTIPIVYRIE